MPRYQPRAIRLSDPHAAYLPRNRLLGPISATRKARSDQNPNLYDFSVASESHPSYAPPEMPTRTAVLLSSTASGAPMPLNSRVSRPPPCRFKCASRTARPDIVNLSAGAKSSVTGTRKERLSSERAAAPTFFPAVPEYEHFALEESNLSPDSSAGRLITRTALFLIPGLEASSVIVMLSKG